MEYNQIEQILLINSNKLPPESIPAVRKKLESANDSTIVQVVFAQMKDPTTSLILSILLGVYGVDRFYLGDIGYGVGKLITCGGVWIWWLIDIFMIQDATRRKNFEKLMMQLTL